jgi:hypothetical protein
MVTGMDGGAAGFGCHLCSSKFPDGIVAHSDVFCLLNIPGR